SFERIHGVFLIDKNLEGVKKAIDSRESGIKGESNGKSEGVIAYWKALLSEQEQNIPQALTHLEESSKAFRDGGADAWRARVEMRRAGLLAGEKSFDDASRALGEAVDLFESTLKDNGSAADAHLQLGAILEQNWSTENSTTAIWHYRKAYALSGEQK